jgi:XTP/dITP diphosphohydrolase
MKPVLRLVVGSKNPDKVAEIESVLEETELHVSIARGFDWPDIEETGETFEANALLKARMVVAATGLPALADDTGLEVAALGGAPGVRTARYSGPNATYADNVARLLVDLRHQADRRATFRTVVALARPDGVEITAEGTLEGIIARAPRGSSGFGYDPVFEVDGLTLAEMSPQQKNLLSHRARALRSLASVLASD